MEYVLPYLKLPTTDFVFFNRNSIQTIDPDSNVERWGNCYVDVHVVDGICVMLSETRACVMFLFFLIVVSFFLFARLNCMISDLEKRIVLFQCIFLLYFIIISWYATGIKYATNI
jgi:hypothetical protein